MRARTQAPELFAFPAVISAAADVYAFAVLAWMVCTREQPYRNLQSADTAMAAMLTQAGPTPTPYALPHLPLYPFPSTPLPLPVPLPLPLPLYSSPTSTPTLTCTLTRTPTLYPSPYPTPNLAPISYSYPKP